MRKVILFSLKHCLGPSLALLVALLSASRSEANTAGGGWASVNGGFDRACLTLVVFDDGAGHALYAGGLFTLADGLPASHVARWNGSSWSALGAGLGGDARALIGLDASWGRGLYAGGRFTSAGGENAEHVARWDGTAWHAVGSGVDGQVLAFCVFDDGRGPALYAAGNFRTAGGTAVNYVARWDGTAWSSLGTGLDGVAKALAVFDDGSGPALYVAGSFSRAGDEARNFIARWDGERWSSLGTGLSARVRTLAVHDDGEGPALYAGGFFTRAGDVVVNYVARWDGLSWAPLCDGVDFYVHTLAVFPQSGGPAAALYVGGFFEHAAEEEAKHIARWQNANWSRVEGGTNQPVFSLAAFNDGNLESLYVGGNFSSAGGAAASHIARWSASCRMGNVNTGVGSAANVLLVNGSPGDEACRRVEISSQEPAAVSIGLPPGGGSGQYMIWLYDGEPGPLDPIALQVQSRNSPVIDLGIGCRALPLNNLVDPGACPCPVTFPLGRTSRNLGQANASRLCLGAESAAPRAPTTFSGQFPRGTFVLGGIIADQASPNRKLYSICNWVVVESS